MYDGDERVPYIMSHKWYTIWEWIVILVLPTVGTAYAVLGEIWGFPYISEIQASILTISMCLGIILGIQNKRMKGEENE